jgi:phosphonate transport system substrate-binding protein
MRSNEKIKGGSEVKKSLFVMLSLLLVATMVLTGCAKEAKLGTEENPIQWVFVPSGEMEDVTAGADAVADLVFKETGLVIDTFVATDYTAAIEALCSGKAQMGSLATFAAITAADRGCAYPALVATRYGSSTYTGQIIAGADTGITSIEDLKGTTFCATDETSTSGWIIPSIEMKAAGIDPEKDLDVVFAGSHDAAVIGVYNGDCQAGASFVDARTSVEDEFPDVMDKVVQVQISMEIPNDGVQFIKDFPADDQTAIVNALLAIMQTDEGKAAMKSAYQWDGLEVHDNTFYDGFRQLLDAAGVTAEDL